MPPTIGRWLVCPPSCPAPESHGCGHQLRHARPPGLAREQVNASVQGFATEPMLGAAYPPRAWVDQELGFGFGEGPSLQLTLLHLGAQNRRARKMLERAEPKKRESRLDRERRLDRLAEAARQERAAR